MGEWMQCNRCFFFFDCEKTDNGGSVIYNGQIIGYACNQCQAKIWGREDVDAQDGK